MRIVPDISGGASSANGLSLLAGPFDELRAVTWDSTTNVIPPQAPPTLTVAYSQDRTSAVVTMSCDVDGAEIRYSTNGRYATTHVNSPVYSGPITVKQSAVFHACWYYKGLKSKAARASVYLKT